MVYFERTRSAPSNVEVRRRPAPTRQPVRYLNIPTYELVKERQAASGRQPSTAARELRAFRHPAGAQKLETRAVCCRPIGADRDRTGNLRVANAALSQLSYGPGILTRSRLARSPGASGPAAAESPREDETDYNRHGHVHQRREVHHDLQSLTAVRGRPMGPTRFELVTSSLSGTRSNQLSYEPFFGRGPTPAQKRAGLGNPSCCGPTRPDLEPRHVANPVGRHSSPLASTRGAV